MEDGKARDFYDTVEELAPNHFLDGMRRRSPRRVVPEREV